MVLVYPLQMFLLIILSTVEPILINNQFFINPSQKIVKEIVISSFFYGFSQPLKTFLDAFTLQCASSNDVPLSSFYTL